MSYRCQNCNAVHYGAANKVITKEREVTYDHCFIKKFKQQGEQKEVQQSVFKSQGREIAEELLLCDTCTEHVATNEPKIINEKTIVHFLPKQSQKTSPLQEGKYNSFAEAFNTNERKHNDRKDKRHDQED